MINYVAYASYPLVEYCGYFGTAPLDSFGSNRYYPESSPSTSVSRTLLLASSSISEAAGVVEKHLVRAEARFLRPF